MSVIGCMLHADRPPVTHLLGLFRGRMQTDTLSLTFLSLSSCMRPTSSCPGPGWRTQGNVPTCLPVQGFNPAEVPTSYGDTIHFWDWQERKLVQSIKLGSAGGLLLP